MSIKTHFRNTLLVSYAFFLSFLVSVFHMFFIVSQVFLFVPIFRKICSEVEQSSVPLSPWMSTFNGKLFLAANHILETVEKVDI